MASLFALCVLCSCVILGQISYAYLREQGLLAFLPSPVVHFFTSISVFDMLVSVFIYKRFSKLVYAIVTPFVEANTPEEAKKMLRKDKTISQNV